VALGRCRERAIPASFRTFGSARLGAPSPALGPPPVGYVALVQSPAVRLRVPAVLPGRRLDAGMPQDPGDGRDVYPVVQQIPRHGPAHVVPCQGLDPGLLRPLV